MEMSWITAISQLYSQIINLFRNAILKLIHIRLFDLLTRCHYILNPPRKLEQWCGLIIRGMCGKGRIHYRIVPKFSNARKFCCNYTKVFQQKKSIQSADGMAE